MYTTILGANDSCAIILVLFAENLFVSIKFLSFRLFGEKCLNSFALFIMNYFDDNIYDITG